MGTTTKSRKASEITSAAIFSVTDKATGQCLGYGVPSDTEPGTIYFVTWNATKRCYDCTCKGGQCANCKHRRAVVSVLAAKKEIAREGNIGNFFEALATFAQQAVSEMAVQEVEKQIASQPVAAASETPTSVAVTATKPVTKPVITARGTAPLKGSTAVGLAQMKNTPAPRARAVPMR